jgi:glycine/D-amino acid oxidase-like deaminating enzyme
MPREPIVVVGAGIIGASIAYHLATRGARVIIVEASQAAAGASGKSFGWINATFSKHPRHYFDLNAQAIAEWHRLERELHGAVTIQWGGSVTWCTRGDEAADLEQGIRNHQEWGYAVRSIHEVELRGLLPAVEPGEVGSACFCESEGAVDAAQAVDALLAQALKSGAEFRCPCEYAEVQQAGTVMLASGVAIPQLATMAGIRVPLKDSPGVLIHTTPLPKLLDRVVIAPGVHFKQSADGRVVAGGQLVAGAGTASGDDINQAGEIVDQARRYLPALRDASIDHVTLGHRVMPEDEYPIVGFSQQCPNVYIAATHSGVTLAPLIGRLAAIEILDGENANELAPYRPSRFV